MQKFDGENFDEQNFDKVIVGFIGKHKERNFDKSLAICQIRHQQTFVLAIATVYINIHASIIVYLDLPGFHKGKSVRDTNA